MAAAQVTPNQPFQRIAAKDAAPAERDRWASQDESMTDDRDKSFFDRADAFIHLANEQGGNVKRAQVSASFSYGAARYNIFVSACKAESAEHLKASKEMVLEYFVKEYRLALEENLDEYVRNFDSYFSESEP